MYHLLRLLEELLEMVHSYLVALMSILLIKNFTQGSSIWRLISGYFQCRSSIFLYISLKLNLFPNFLLIKGLAIVSSILGKELTSWPIF